MDCHFKISIAEHMEVNVETNPKIILQSPSESGSFYSIALESLTARAEYLTASTLRLRKEFHTAAELILAYQTQSILFYMEKIRLIKNIRENKIKSLIVTKDLKTNDGVHGVLESFD